MDIVLWIYNSLFAIAAIFETDIDSPQAGVSMFAISGHVWI